MSYTTQQSDSFNRANGALDHSAPDNANGGSDSVLWLEYYGSGWTVASNRAVNPGAPGVYVIATNGTPYTDGRVSAIVYGSAIAPVAPVGRLEIATNKFYMFDPVGTDARLYYFDGAAFNLLITTTFAGFADGDELAIVCNGTTISGEVNGTTVVTIPLQSQIASGIPGMYSPGSSTGFDSWKYQTGTASVSTPTHLAIATAPVGNQSGVALTTQPAINVLDSGNSVVTGDTSTVVASINVLTGSVTLGGTTSKAAVAGVSTFTNLAPTGTGSYTLTFSDGALTTVTTGTLYVGATQLAITSAPTTAFSKHATTIVVTAKDASGVAVGNYTGTVAVTLNKISGSSSVATMTGGTSSAAAVAGVATLTPIATTSDNGLVATSYTYTAAASGLTSATTATITPTVSESIAVTIT